MDIEFQNARISVFFDRRRKKVVAIISGATPEVLHRLQKPAVVSELARRCKADFPPLEVEDAIRTRVRQFLPVERTVSNRRRERRALRQALRGKGNGWR